jgi:hypothetical protein
LPPARTHFCDVAARERRAVLDPGEDVLELHHARIGEHQRRVVARHQRARGDDLVPVWLEIVEKGLADVVHAAHDGPFVCKGESQKVPDAIANRRLLSSISAARNVQTPRPGKTRKRPQAFQGTGDRSHSTMARKRPRRTRAAIVILAAARSSSRNFSAISPAFADASSISSGEPGCRAGTAWRSRAPARAAGCCRRTRRRTSRRCRP